jgi:hypothetical protein
MTFPDLRFSEQLTTQGFGLNLYDGFTGEPQLQGEVMVSIGKKKAAVEKSFPAMFVFPNLPPGSYSISVEAAPDTPFYSNVSIPINTPMPDPLWPAYPDISLADKSKPLDDPSQPAAYRAQRALATLVPTPRYPFPPGATLLRGTVLAGTVPLAGATVERVASGSLGQGGDSAVSDGNGEFVLFFTDVDGMGEVATIQATHPLRPNTGQVQVTLQRGTTTSTRIVL